MNLLSELHGDEIWSYSKGCAFSVRKRQHLSTLCLLYDALSDFSEFEAIRFWELQLGEDSLRLLRSKHSEHRPKFETYELRQWITKNSMITLSSTWVTSELEKLSSNLQESFDATDIWMRNETLKLCQLKRITIALTVVLVPSPSSLSSDWFIITNVLLIILSLFSSIHPSIFHLSFATVAFNELYETSD